MRKMVDLRLSDEEKSAKLAENMLGDPTAVPDFAWGRCIKFTDRELDKLGLTGDCDVGDILDMHCMAEVTSVFMRKTGGETCCEVELQITHVDAMEDDDDDDDEDGDE